MSLPDWSDGYIKGVLSGKIPANAEVIKAVERHKRDLKRGRYVFDETLVTKAVRFIELMPHTKGAWASKGLKLKLEPWQKFIVGSIFGWVDRNGKRRFREAYVRVPRKNGKSALAAAIGLYMLVSDGEQGAEVYSGATNLPQAKEVFKPAWIMMQKYDKLRERTKTELYGTPANPSQIYCKANQSVFKPIKGKPGDGSSPHCAIIDEYHEHPDSTMYDAMLTGMGARQQPLLFIITTAGTRTDGPCYAKDKECSDLLEGLYENDRLFTIMYGIDQDDDPFSVDALVKANPNYGVSVMPDYLEMQMQNALNRGGNDQTIYMIKHLNKWVSARSSWMNMGLWNQLGSDQAREHMKGLKVYVGLDLASKLDITAMQFMAYDSEQQMYYTFGRYYLPESAIKRCHASVRHLYEDLTQKGHIIVTPGEMTDYEFIRRDLKQIATELDIERIGFDPWGSEVVYQDLVRDGWESRLEQFSMTTKNRSEPMKQIEAQVVAGKLQHDNNPAMNWMMGNVTARLDANDNIVPRKDSNERKIDAVDAMIIAMGMILSDLSQQQSTAFVDGLYFI